MLCVQLQNICCNMYTSHIISQLLESTPCISSINIVRLKAASQIQDNCRPWNQKEKEIFKNAILMRSNFKIPFWSSLMISNMENENWSKACILAANRHNKNDDYLVLSPKQFRSHISDLEQSGYGINSCVTLFDGSILHIPMIDFHIGKSKINEDIVCTVCKSLIPDGGYIIDSGNSYHFIGKGLITTSQLLTLLAKSILFTPIVDEIWVAHQIIERSCTLRIGLKNGLLPTLIRII